jgi:hypothetical protein
VPRDNRGITCRTPVTPGSDHCRVTHDLQRHLKDCASRLGDGPVTLRELVDLHGPSVPGSLLIIVAAPCVLPIPGIGNVLGTAMVLLALALWRGADPALLPERVANWQMPSAAARRVLLLLAGIYGLAGRWSRQRLTRLARIDPRSWLAPKVALMGVVIFLPLPLGNLLPALAVTVLGVGVSMRDGVAVAASVVLAGASMGYALALAAGAWVWMLEPLLN